MGSMDLCNVDWNRRAMCRRCHCIIVDCEPMLSDGEFYHPSTDKDGKPYYCKNAGLYLNLNQIKELMPFERKRIRRAAKRAGTKV